MMATRRPGAVPVASRSSWPSAEAVPGTGTSQGRPHALVLTGASRGVSRQPAAASQWPDPSQVDLLVKMERHGCYFGPGGGSVTMTLHNHKAWKPLPSPLKS